jgi:hypothetical protein
MDRADTRAELDRFRAGDRVSEGRALRGRTRATAREPTPGPWVSRFTDTRIDIIGAGGKLVGSIDATENENAVADAQLAKSAPDLLIIVRRLARDRDIVDPTALRQLGEEANDLLGVRRLK